MLSLITISNLFSNLSDTKMQKMPNLYIYKKRLMRKGMLTAMTHRDIPPHCCPFTLGVSHSNALPHKGIPSCFLHTPSIKTYLSIIARRKFIQSNQSKT